MPSVTSVIKTVKQPYGGYIKRTDLSIEYLKDNILIDLDENIRPSDIGLVIDYLSRFMIENDVIKAFDISLEGCRLAYCLGYFNDLDFVAKDLATIQKNYLSDEAIICACQLVQFDSCIRSGYFTDLNTVKDKIPNATTINHIRTMLSRCKEFFNIYKPINFGFTFNPNGYTAAITTGDGDFLSNDTLWDMKVSKKEPNKDWTLQILIYYLMGKHSGQEIFKNITHIGIFNPRLGKIYRLEIAKINPETIKIIETNIIGY